MSDAFIPLCVPEIRGNAWKYVKDCLDTGWVSSVGGYVDRFEQIVAERAGTKFGVAAVNGTAALQISLLVAGVRPDDEVLVSTLTFIAPANTIRYIGAWPVFIDAEPDYWQIDPAKVAHFLEHECRRAAGELRNKTTGRRVSAMLPVHALGHPAQMDALAELARKFGLVSIGDATESLGATCDGKPVAQWSDIACFSFNGNKLLTTGGGGVIVTDNEEWARRAKYLTTQAKDDPVEYIHHEIGFNHRLTNLQAAMGCAQMELLDEYIATKRRIAARYTEAFADLDGLTPMREAPWASSVFWMFTVLIDEARFGLGWRALLAKLQEQNIQTRPLWQPLHQSRAHAGSQVVGGEVAERLYATALSLPCSVGLKPDDQERVIAGVRELSRRP